MQYNLCNLKHKEWALDVRKKTAYGFTEEFTTTYMKPLMLLLNLNLLKRDLYG
jgi:hypothetical protein